MNSSWWMSSEDVSILMENIYIIIDDCPVYDKEILNNILSELEVAHERRHVSRIDYVLLAAVLGKKKKCVPVKIKDEERNILLKYAVLPIS